jgi:membrane protease YdiL (CAAX protease family)
MGLEWDHGPTAIWVWVPFILLNPWFEEVLVRGYVMTEVAELSGSAALAVFVSTAIQTGYHLYQGPVNTVIVGSCFLMLSLYYAKTRKLFPVIMAHTIMDVLAWIHLIYQGHH